MSSDVASPVEKGLRSAFAVVGVLSALIGIAMLFWPVASAKVIIAIFAVWMIVAGFVYLGTAFTAGDRGGWARFGFALLGLIYIAAGVIVFFNLEFTAAVAMVWVAIFIGILWIFEGFSAFYAISQGASAWNILFGIVSIIAGVILVFSPVYGAGVLWWCLAISLIVLGIFQFVRSLAK